jgi:hypothetical protein
MNNVDKVFWLIKDHCEKQKQFAEVNCLEEISARANISDGMLSMCLHNLKEKGLIKYSIAESYIYLTGQGKKQCAPVEM